MKHLTFPQKYKTHYFNSGLRRKLLYLKKHSNLKNRSFCELNRNPDIPNITEIAIIVDISRRSNSLFLPTTTSNFSQQGLNRRNHTCRGGFELESFCSDNCVKLLIVQPLPRREKVLNIYLKLSNQFFQKLCVWSLASSSQSTTLHSYWRIRLKIHSF